MLEDLMQEIADTLDEVIGFWESNEKVHDGTAQRIQGLLAKIQDEQPGEKRRCIWCDNRYKGDITCPICKHNMGRPLVSVYDLPDKSP